MRKKPIGAVPEKNKKPSHFLFLLFMQGFPAKEG
jgi:hypothetical protein